MLITAVKLFFDILIILILARVILSWVRPNPYDKTWGPIIRFVYQLTDPIIEPVRRALPATGGMDFSPIIVMVGLWIAERIIISLMLSI